MSKKVQQASDSIVKKKPDSVPFFKLFRYATKFDYLLMTSGSLTVVINGICLPIVSFCFGKLINAFSPSNSYDETISIAGKYTGILAGIGVLSFLLSYISFASWMITGERQGIEYRKAYFKAFLNQEIGFYDTLNPNELASKVSFECFAIQSGIGEKVCSFTYTITLILAGFVVAFVQGWELALVISAWIPAMIIAGVVLALAMTKAIMSSQQNYYQAGAIIEESLASIKTVVSLNGQEKEVSRYKAILQEALKKATRFGFYIGAGLGLMYTGINGTYLVGLWYGSKLVQEQKINPMTDDPWDMGQVVGIYFALLYGALSMAQITPCLKAFSGARVAAAKAFEIIDRKSKMSVNDGKGAEVRLDGDIEFKGVTFAYLGAPEKKVLDQVSFSIKKNQKTALVGESGSGKTTCMQLIQRFYDIESGSIKFDGQEISGINLKSLRSQIGYVGQEPALFAASIKENLLMAREDATEKDLWEALKKANVADFVNSLPNKLETFVGNNGTQLSGGQKQRLAIARAILKNPKILLLDEATSALDRKNEREIQKTLDDISKGRTTIVIAHRLTTILNSDNIIVFDQGRVIEQGTHEDLIRNHDGKYYNLQKLQLKSDKEAVQEEQDAQQQEPAKGVKTSFEVEVNVHDPLILKDANHRPKSVEPAEEKHVFWRLLSYNKQEAIYIFAGVVSAIVNGATFPLFAIFFANILAILSQPVTPSFREDVNKWLFWFLGDALVCLASNVSQNGFFGLVGENLTLKLRTEVFRKVLKMSMYWFDKPENAPASLSAKLALEAYMANSLTSSTVGNYIQTISSFTTYLVIAFISSWQFALVTLAFAPLFFYSGKIQAAYSQGFSAANDAAYTASSRIIGEVVNNMKTVQSFGAERRLFKAYEDQLQAPLDNATQRGKSSGFAFGTSQFVQISLFALLFLIGAVFVKKINISPKNAFQCIFAFFYCTFTSGNASQFAPDVNFAKRCAKNLFKILDYKPEIDIDEPSQDIKTPIKGEVEFKNVWFKYPSREKYILKGVSFKINAFTKVAFVGSSGCGKSTIFTLLLRFYNPDSGEILVDGIDIKKYDLRHLRKSFGAVFQEPSLFNNTIKYNIKYAREDATDEEMKKAAEDANALTFIEQKEASEGSSSLGTGFYKQVGPKGSQMSGGQKQRIAIARTMITKPSVLLLDEATSALDSQNEKIVQESLDKAMAGKTSIIVAHRISTIKDAQQILVFQDGQIIERGNYETLVRNQGAFYRIEKGLNITK